MKKEIALESWYYAYQLGFVACWSYLKVKYWLHWILVWQDDDTHGCRKGVCICIYVHVDKFIHVFMHCILSILPALYY